MIVYKPIILQLVSLIFLFFYFFINGLKKNNFLKKICLLILLFTLLGLVFFSRDYATTTIDLKHYMHYYDATKTFYDVFNSIIAWKGDYFFFAVMPIAHFIGLGPIGYISFQTALSILLLFMAYYRVFKDSKSLVFLGLFFVINSSSFYLTNGNVLRQGFASSILLIALTSKTSKKYFFTKIFAFFTHRGSMVSFFSGMSPSKKKIRFLILILAFITGYFGLHFQVLLELPLPEFLNRKIIFYSNFERASANSMVKLFLLLFFNVLFIKYYNKNSESKFKRANDLYFIFSIACLLLFRLDTAFSRTILFSDTFLPIIMIGIIMDIKNLKYKSIALITSIIISLMYSLYVFNHSSILFNLGESFELF